MRILVLGGDGMLGHQLLRFLVPGHEVRVTLRQNRELYEKYGLYSEDNAYFGIDVRCLDRLAEAISDCRPQVVINGIGVVKQRTASTESIPSLEINALFPHRLAVLCKDAGARLVHMSTDCVFSGRKGNYQESDPSDAEDLYGRTKFLGEVQDDHCLTLRTSIIGRELSRKSGLLEWFLSQRGSVSGFKNAIFTGFSTLEMSRIIEILLVNYPEVCGVYQVSSDPISKFDLLNLIKSELEFDIEIVPDETFFCDRSLVSTRFRQELGYTPPAWPEMIKAMVQDFRNSGLYAFKGD